jgi:hypothetical protein
MPAGILPALGEEKPEEELMGKVLFTFDIMDKNMNNIHKNWIFIKLFLLF